MDPGPINNMIDEVGIPGMWEDQDVEIGSVHRLNNLNYFKLMDEDGNIIQDTNGNTIWFTNTPDSRFDYIEFQNIEDMRIIQQLANTRAEPDLW